MRGKCGVWLIGARGGVAATSLVGLCALKNGSTESAGLVSELPAFSHLELADWSDFVVGGHEIRSARLFDEAMKLVTQSRAIDERLVLQCRSELDEIERSHPSRNGVAKRADDRPVCRSGGAPETRRPAKRSPACSVTWRSSWRLRAPEHLIVLNVASTEPPVALDRLPRSWADLERLLDEPEDCILPASSLYAIAALDRGWSYINFTPSLGSAPQAINELAGLRRAQHMGCDGKTGETLLKSTLAPMFRDRNLHVMSWVGHNIFGNADAVVLNDPVNKQTKVASKDHLLHEILGYKPQTLVSIEYIESLGDWKTAWDHIHFKGFLSTPMTLQFIWQGCDSLLAAPLVLDLLRFTEMAHRRGNVGRLTFLASFFKSPYGVQQHDFSEQFRLLEAWAGS